MPLRMEKMMRGINNSRLVKPMVITVNTVKEMRKISRIMDIPLGLTRHLNE